MELRAALSSTGLLVHRLGRLARRRPAVRILYYHSISDAPVRSRVSAASFAGQIEYLVRGGYNVASLSHVAAALAARSDLPPRTVVVTLDDGFRDNYEEAFPILDRFHVPATIFLTAGYIGTDRLPTLSGTEFVPRPLTWAHVREMHGRGIEFGSHTLTHATLSLVPASLARHELAESKRLIEDELGSAVTLFCYPRGDFNEPVRQFVGEAGYRAACTTRPGVNDCRTDPLALRRTYVSRRDTLEEFGKKVAGGYDLLQHILRLRRHFGRRRAAG